MEENGRKGKIRGRTGKKKGIKENKREEKGKKGHLKKYYVSKNH